MTEKDKEIEKLKEGKLIDESIITKFRKDFQIFDEKMKKLESDVEAKNCQIKEMQKHIDCLKADLVEAQGNKIRLPHEPLKVAEILIFATERRENCMTGKEYDKPVYEKWQLEQIAEHLLVYCKHNKEDVE